MNLPTPKNKRSHYQERRAQADGWKIECLQRGSDDVWAVLSHAMLEDHNIYRIVPDANGWLPWYQVEDAACPFDGDVDIILADGSYRQNKEGCRMIWRKEDCILAITHYRPHKERKLIKTVKHFDDGTEEVCE